MKSGISRKARQIKRSRFSKNSLFSCKALEAFDFGKAAVVIFECGLDRGETFPFGIARAEPPVKIETFMKMDGLLGCSDIKAVKFHLRRTLITECK